MDVNGEPGPIEVQLAMFPPAEMTPLLILLIDTGIFVPGISAKFKGVAYPGPEIKNPNTSL
jgi:hypothetical protein